MRTVEEFLFYIEKVKRYSPNTVAQYRRVLEQYFSYALNGELTAVMIRNYELYLMESLGDSPRTVNLHLSVLSAYCKYLMKTGVLKADPVRSVVRPKQEKRLPSVFRSESVDEFFDTTKGDAEFGNYPQKLERLILSILFNTGIRRSELISLDRSAYDISRSVLHVKGKGDKMRDVPVVEELKRDLDFYIASCDERFGPLPSDSPLLLTPKGRRLYPVLVDRAVKKAMSGVQGATGRKSPHVLRHTLATQLLGSGAGLNSIKELLGHSSLAATQVYTHNSIERMKAVYKDAHPRAVSGIENAADELDKQL